MGFGYYMLFLIIFKIEVVIGHSAYNSLLLVSVILNPEDMIKYEVSRITTINIILWN